jgi:hypothetical protein
MYVNKNTSDRTCSVIDEQRNPDYILEEQELSAMVEFS